MGICGTDSFTFTWDSENRLVKVESRSDTPQGSWRRVEWQYDALGRRIRHTTWSWLVQSNLWVVTEDLKFLSDPLLFGRHVVDLNASNNVAVRTYVWGLDLSETMDGAGGVGGLLWVTLHPGSGAGAGTHFCAYDGNGNIVALSAASDGSVTARYEYGPFGEPIRLSGPAAANSPFRFSTKRTCHTTDLVLYEYRAYSPSTGRWPSRDPIGEEGGPNVYGFVNNAGIDQVDPLGLYGSSIDNAVRTCMALPSPAARTKCLEDLIDTLGGGKPKRCCVLAAVVRVAKEKAAGLGKCQRSDSCAVLKAKSDAWLAVAAARARLNTICFGGGDPGHQQQLADVWVVIGRCTKYQVEKGCKGPL